MASASKAQIKANRQNAKRSTGPKTSDGKEIVSKNAISHGAYVQSFMNQIEETHYQLFLKDLKTSYPSNNPIIIAQIERLAKSRTMLDRIQRTISVTYDVSESMERTDESLMDLLRMDEAQRSVAKEIAAGEINIDGIINVKKIRIATELTYIDTSRFTSHDDFLFHTPLLCKYLFDEATSAKVSIDSFITHISYYSNSSDKILERLSKILLKTLVNESQEEEEEIDIYAPYPPPKTLESEIKKASLGSLRKAVELFKDEHNKLANLHHKVITFNKLRKFEFSPIPLDLDELSKLYKIQGNLQNQYSKILGEFLALINNQSVYNSGMA